MTRPYGKGQIKKGISLFQKHIDLINALVKAKYAAGISSVIRKALEEAAEREGVLTNDSH